MIEVLVVEDEPIVAEAHQTYVARLPGFVCAGVAHSQAQALRFLQQHPVDLVLLDMYLPDGHGLDLCRRLRAAGQPVDIIAVTSAKDLAVVQQAVSQGVVQYLIKPFSYEAFAGRLTRYARYRDQLARGAGQQLEQNDIDQAMSVLRAPATQQRGLTTETMQDVVMLLRGQTSPVSASQVAERLGISRVTARRYLEHLADDDRIHRAPRYGRTGRPELEYSWKSREH